MKKCIITGGNSGIGYEAAMQIAAKGFHVTLMCRNEKKAIQSCKQISEKTDNPNVDYLIADLSVMKQVKDAATLYLKKHSTLDVLINNAADFDLSVKKPVITEEGVEKQFATNVVAPFLLSQLFMDALKRSGDGKIINISSQGLCVFPFIKLNFDNINGEMGYSPSSTYYQNKLALLTFSLYMRELHYDITIQAIRVTNVKIDMTRYDNINPILKKAYAIKSKFSISPAEMAEIYTMLATEKNHKGFLYNEKGKEVKANASAYFKESQEKLYKLLISITN